MAESGAEPEAIVEAKGLRQIADAGAIGQVVEEVLAANPGGSRGL